jgi:hypothetical protein
MSGNSRGFVKGVIGGIRVANKELTKDGKLGGITYYPAHSKNGSNVNQRCVIRGCVNIPSKMKGGAEKKVYLTFTVWNKLADTMARSCSEGKEFDVLDFEFNQYDAQIYTQDAAGNSVAVTLQTPAGPVALKTPRLGITIKEIRFGGESAKFISRDMERGHRAVGWDIPGTPANIAWKATLAIRNSEQYVPGKERFGFAKVIAPKGPGIGAYDPNQKPTYGQAAVATPAATTEAAVMAATAAGAINPAVAAAAPGVVVKGL